MICIVFKLHNTVNRKFFVVKIFSDSMGSVKIKRTNIMRIINANAVRSRLSENYLTRKLIARNIFDTKYYRFTVYKYTRVKCKTIFNSCCYCVVFVDS